MVNSDRASLWIIALALCSCGSCIRIFHISYSSKGLALKFVNTASELSIVNSTFNSLNSSSNGKCIALIEAKVAIGLWLNASATMLAFLGWYSIMQS